MEQWTSESNPGLQMTSSLACLVVGLILAYSCRDLGDFAISNTFAGFLLGILLWIIGMAGILTVGKQKITIDPKERRILVENSSPFGKKERMILFSDINHIGVSYLGKESNLVTFYSLLLTLRNGEEYTLFAPGRFYKGSRDRNIVEGWRSRLGGYIGPRERIG
jgi:hypothetical protein